MLTIIQVKVLANILKVFILTDSYENAVLIHNKRDSKQHSDLSLIYKTIIIALYDTPVYSVYG